MVINNLPQEMEMLSNPGNNNEKNSAMRKWMERLLSFIIVLNLLVSINLTVKISNLETKFDGNMKLQELRFKGVENDVTRIELQSYTQKEIQFFILQSETGTRNWTSETFVRK